MDKDMSYAVEEAFIRMHEKNVHRSTRIVNWSCTLKSTISDIEVEKTELKGRTLIPAPGYDEPVEFGVLTYFAYLVENSKEEIVVATSRLETMLGGTAAAVHPDDDRYKDLHGKYVQHPFLQRRLPILANTMVDSACGSDAVKVTPTHDPNDFEYGRQLNLQFITCINDDGLMSSECGRYSGKLRFHVRRPLLHDLKERRLFRDSKESEMILPICSLSKSIIELLLKPQCSDDIPPENETDDHNWISAHTYEEALDKAEQRLNISKYKTRLTQDEDVLEAWFSSSLLPFSSFVEAGHDILFSWIAPMVMMSLELTGRLPFTEVYLQSIIRDADACKMSQTLRDVINPLDLIHDISLEKLQKRCKSSNEAYPDSIPEYGTDILRFAICDYVSEGQYINLNKFHVERSRDFCNNRWNVIRFAMSKNLDINDSNCFQPPTEFELTVTETPCDLWILSRLSYAIEQCESGFKRYQFPQIATAIYNFWFPELDDIYIQYVKKDFYPEKPKCICLLSAFTDDSS
ncbi:unnamed protein product [Rotaria socialis]|uniref:valine--tRNA ligase n=1 Tax=Rotaria socialis TaxID=392032 RepID=A0A821UN62_9BILA|nr:unnamed protein product [Rotaria socialis]CAF4892882.1 unnamed protein product [Rotaria socialis]